MTSDDRRLAAELYAATFAGRVDAYSVHTGSQWIAVREPLTADVVLRAFETKRPVSGYLLAPDSTTSLACLDVDLEDGLLVADRVARVMTAAGAPAYVEPSRRGAHLWCQFGPWPLPGIVVRRALRAFLQHAGVSTTDPKIELRPGQDRLNGPDSLGNALRLPLMPHPMTGIRGPLLAPGGRIVATKVPELLTELDSAPSEVIGTWAERWQPPLDPRAIPPAYRTPRRHDDGPDTTVTALLAQMGVVGRPGKAIRCPFHDDHNPSLSIARDEQRVFCKSPACDASNSGRGLGTRQLAALIRGRVAAA